MATSTGLPFLFTQDLHREVEKNRQDSNIPALPATAIHRSFFDKKPIDRKSFTIAQLEAMGEFFEINPKRVKFYIKQLELAGKL